MELRRARWLEKLSHMDHTRVPRLLLGAWMPEARKNGTAGRLQQSIRHMYACTLKKLGYEGNFQFKEWMEHARNRKEWEKKKNIF